MRGLHNSLLTLDFAKLDFLLHLVIVSKQLEEPTLEVSRKGLLPCGLPILDFRGLHTAAPERRESSREVVDLSSACWSNRLQLKGTGRGDRVARIRSTLSDDGSARCRKMPFLVFIWLFLTDVDMGLQSGTCRLASVLKQVQRKGLQLHEHLALSCWHFELVVGRALRKCMKIVRFGRHIVE